jgi:hypothetical protein
MRRGALVAALFAVLITSTGVRIAAAQSVPERTHTTTNFSITWVDDASDPSAPDLTDTNGDGLPDAVERMAAAFEAARTFLLVDLGYQAPPVQGLYPLYIAAPGSTGRTQPAPGGVGNSQPSFIVVPPEFVQSGESDATMGVLAVHEYFHAIQIGYDAAEQHWITEASSAWVEDLFVDGVDHNHPYLRDFLPFPRTSLAASNERHEYGAFLFLQFLTERYGGGSVEGAPIVRELWEEMAVPEAINGAPDRDAVGAIEAVLTRRGTTLTDAWSEFLIWRRRLGHFGEGASYRAAAEGTGFRSLLRASTVRAESCRLDSDDEDEELARLSGDYVGLVPHGKGPRATNATLTVQGPVGATASYMLKRKGAPVRERVLTFRSDGVASDEVPFGWVSVKNIIVALGNGSSAPEGMTLAYSLRLPGADRVAVSGPTGASVVQSGTAALISGSVTCGGAPAPFADIVVTEQEVVSGRSQTFAVETDERGSYRVVTTPQANAMYEVELVDPLLSPEKPDRTLRVDVQVIVRLELVDDQVPAGTPVEVTGEVFPAHPGAPIAVEFRRPAGAWQFGAEATVMASGSYSASFVPPDTGIYEVRANMLATNDDDHVPGISAGKLLEVEP